MGQKSTYNREDGETICAALAEGHSLLSICEAMGLSYKTARDWEVDVPEHGSNAARARALGCDVMAEDMLRIADTPCLGVETVTKGDGSVEVREGDMLQHRRLQLDTRKWLLSKWASKLYGDKATIEHEMGDSIAAAIAAARARSRPPGK